MTVLPSVSSGDCPIALPAKDRPIFMTALRCGATHLLTGDMRRFGPFMDDASQTAGIRITTVAAFLEGDRGQISNAGLRPQPIFPDCRPKAALPVHKPLSPSREGPQVGILLAFSAMSDNFLVLLCRS
jgi:hypothetical protein